MRSTCSSCGNVLSANEMKEGYCNQCGYNFNPYHDDWVIESPEQYDGMLTTISGREVSVSRMAEQHLQGKILKRFGLFAATTEGIECLDHYYYIDKKSLGETDWLEHMKRKTWVNIEDFRSALEHVKKFS